tara:strand:+ start:2749 stop:3075 length:327 start_codon:yes stop_codon:yes gene_type:complete
MNKNLYFTIGSAPSDAADDALMINADLFLAMGPTTATTTKMYFLDRANTGAAETIITLTHAEGRNIDVIEDVCEAMSGEPRDGFIVIADPTGGEFCSPYITDAALTQL